MSLQRVEQPHDSADTRSMLNWMCDCGAVVSESRTAPRRVRPPHRRGICWIAWDSDTERYGGYLGELDDNDTEIALVENSPAVRDLDRIIAWARGAASVVIIRPEFDPSTHYSAGQRRAGRRGLPELPSR
jgi:hypothetical protein